jgi:putative spermidine/putrescine transport system ATP-binding protein
MKLAAQVVDLQKIYDLGPALEPAGGANVDLQYAPLAPDEGRILVKALRGVSLDFPEGDFVAIMGASGSGKSTLLNILGGLDRPTSGHYVLGGVDVSQMSDSELSHVRNQKIGFIFQSYNLIMQYTVLENIELPLQYRPGYPPLSKADQEHCLELATKVGLADRLDHRPFQLSGGQQQRVALARALAIQPQLLLLDEPLSALDAKIRIALRSEIRRIQQQLGITTIYVTHDQEEALSISDRIVVMHDGKVEQVGTPFEIYNFPQTQFVASFVGTLNTAIAEIVDPANGLLSVDGVQFVSAEKMEGLRRGDKVRIAIRPERFSFASDGKKVNVVDCRIENITFLGSVVRIQILIGNTKFNMDTFNNPFLALPKIGDMEQVTCSKEAVLILGVADQSVASPEGSEPNAAVLIDSADQFAE